jgi:phosphohistidine swiveling domain-containing protein
MVFTVLTTKAALGAIVTRVPTVVGALPDPVVTVRTGDLVRVDGDAGIVAVLTRAGDTLSMSEKSAGERARH